jgi:mannose-6-phosphate isomerase-like protein (cupin superfamily)
MNRLERKRPQIDPTKIRKHSQIVAEKQDPFLVVGDRTQTDYGFFVTGVTQKTFETLHMVLMPNTITPTWTHQKKVRIYRVVSGSGYYQQVNDDGSLLTRPLAPGDEVLVAAGHAHRLSSGVLRMELYVTQDAKYSAHLEEVAPAETVATVDPSDLRSITAAEKHSIVGSPVGVSRRAKSRRAAEQIAALRGDRSNSTGGLARSAEAADNFLRGTASVGVNAKPVFDFSEEGAG